MAHTPHSPSKAEQWYLCAGSLNLIAKANLPSVSSSYADEGTAKHTLTARCLDEGSNPADYLNESIEVNGVNWVIDEDFAEHVGYAVDVVRTLLLIYPNMQLYVEQRVDLSEYLGEGEGGTADAILIDLDTGHMIVIDFKFGRGVRVVAKRNKQLFLYGLGAYLSIARIFCDPSRVQVMVVQPLLDHVDEDSMTLTELLEFGTDMAQAAERTRDPAAPLTPGSKQCRFCAVKGICPALADEVTQTLPVPAEAFEDLDAVHLPTVDVLTNEQLARLLPMEDTIREFLDAARGEATRRLSEGQGIDGWKLVQGKRGPRQWVKGEEATVATYLDETVRLRQDEIYTKKLISPTQVEKLVGPTQYRRLMDYITQSDGALAIAPLSDKRPAVTPVALPEEFEALPE